MVIKEETRVSIDVGIPGDRNVIMKGTEKTVRCTDRTTEIQCMWNVKAKVIPIIIGATGNISKSLQSEPEQQTGKARNEGNADNSHIGHCTQTAGSADVKLQNIFQEQNNITRSTDCK